MLEKLKNLLQFRKSSTSSKTEVGIITTKEPLVFDKRFSKKTIQKLQIISDAITLRYLKIEESYKKRKAYRLEHENDLAMNEQKLIAQLHEEIEKLQQESNEIQTNEILIEETPIVEPEKEVKTTSTRFRYGPNGLTKMPFPDN